MAQPTHIKGVVDLLDYVPLGRRLFYVSHYTPFGFFCQAIESISLTSSERPSLVAVCFAAAAKGPVARLVCLDGISPTARTRGRTTC